MATFDLRVKTRTETGKGVARKLRAAEQLPAVLYGMGRESLGLIVSEMDLRLALSTSARGRVVLNLDIEGEKGGPVPALVKDIQRHPVGGEFLHADLLAIQLDKPVQIRVPIISTDAVPVGVKTDGGVLEWMRRDVLIEVLPRDIPDRIEVDLADLELNQSLTAMQIVGEAFKLVTKGETPICHVVATRMSLEVVGEGEEVEGEEGVEGAEGAEGAAAEGEEAGAKPDAPAEDAGK